MLRRCITVVAAYLLTSVALPARQFEPRRVTETDLLAFTWVADAQISPDGSTIAFVKVVVNEREISRSGEPWHRVERLRHILGWMDRWLDPSS